MTITQKWIKAVVTSNLKPTTKLILHTLAFHMDSKGERCRPTIDQLEDETGLGRTAIVNHLKIARKAGWIEVSEHHVKGQRWKNHSYFPAVPKAPRSSLGEPCREQKQAEKPPRRSSLEVPRQTGDAVHEVNSSYIYNKNTNPEQREKSNIVPILNRGKGVRPKPTSFREHVFPVQDKSGGHDLPTGLDLREWDEIFAGVLAQ